jgi:hypothetical protein
LGNNARTSTRAASIIVVVGDCTLHQLSVAVSDVRRVKGRNAHGRVPPDDGGLSVMILDKTCN